MANPKNLSLLPAGLHDLLPPDARKESRAVAQLLECFESFGYALRLARFNTNLAEESREPWQLKFFVGIPSPAGAMLALLPLVSSFYAPGILDNAFFCSFWAVVIGALMASRIPTFAAKKVRIHHEWLLTLMIAGGVVIVLVFTQPWMMFTLAGLIYCALIPVSAKHYRRLALLHTAGHDGFISPNESRSAE